MFEPDEKSSIEPTTDILVVGLNKDKTRKAIAPVSRHSLGSGGLDTEYQVYFELSGTPSQAWGNIFEREWMAMTQPPLWEKASIDNGFLVMHCLLEDIAAMHLPVLKKAVLATNASYHHHTQQQAMEQEHRNDAWKHERKTVDEMAESLHFE